MKIAKSNLTAFYYAVSIIEVAQVPYLEEAPTMLLLRNLYSLTDGNSDSSLELLRIAPKDCDHSIRHFLVLRTMHPEKAACTENGKRLFEMIHNFMEDNGYGCHEVKYDDFCALYRSVPHDEGFFLCRDTRKDLSGALYIPHLQKVDTQAVYAALNGSDCSFSLQITPSKTSPSEAKYMRGLSHLYRDHRHDPAFANALQLLSQRSTTMHTFGITMTVSGAGARGVVSRLAAAMDIPCTVLPAKSNEYDLWSLPEQPWIRSKVVDGLLYQRCRSGFGFADPPLCGLFTRFIPMEAAQLLALPLGGKGFVGLRENIFSLLPRSSVCDPRLMGGGPDSIVLGLSQRGLPIYLPLDELPKGLAGIGMSGSGKSTFEACLVHQARQKNIPVMLISGAKRECRSLLKKYPGKICTPGVNIAPMFMNPFQVPKYSTVASHKSAVVTVLASAVNMPSPLDALLTCAVSRAYEAFGYRDDSSWDDGTPFGVRDFLSIYQDMLASSDYKGEVKGNLQAAARFRLVALLERAGNMMDVVHNTFDPEALLDGLTVIELEGLEETDRKLAGFLILTSVMAYLHRLPESGGALRLAIMIDEAHALLSAEDEDSLDASRLAGQAIRNLMLNALTTVRAQGIGLAYFDQSINRTGTTLFDQVGTKVIFRLNGLENRLAADCLQLDPKQAKCLLNLGVGQAMLKTPLNTEVMGLHTLKFQFGDHISDDELRRMVNTALPANQDPARISVRLLEGNTFPRPDALFHVLNALDIPTATAVIADLERRAVARRIPVPKDYQEVMARYISEKRRKG